MLYRNHQINLNNTKYTAVIWYPNIYSSKKGYCICIYMYIYNEASFVDDGMSTMQDMAITIWRQ